ncbi:MAG: tRNA dihydrouridine synthase DusB [Termitinemataceae bacterium]|nr:MAG: tRNA dihydrouridine synthase DusB [Termitinemataceae bacterium]
MRPIKIGSLSLPGNLFLAPVAGYSEAAFRSVCIDFGADFTFTELISSEAISRGSEKTFKMLKRFPNEKQYAIQLFGAKASVMFDAACALKPFNPSMIDLNAGCPVPKITKQGAGSALMRDPSLLGNITSSLKKAATEELGGIPVSVKMRSGWDASSINYFECAEAAIEGGADMISLHARTKTQGYEGCADIDHIADLKSRVKTPVCASGDLWSAKDALNVLQQTGCDAVMFARGAIGRPWVFAETKEQIIGSVKRSKIERQIIIETAFKHLGLLCRMIDEKNACTEMRKVFCAYTKGMENSASLRKAIVQCNSITDYENVFSS